jgi:hypothetical protein
MASYVNLMEEQVAFWSFVDFISSKHGFFKISLRWLFFFFLKGKFNECPQNNNNKYTNNSDQWLTWC